ncbi:MAG: type II toxin-antitoxin system MqsA family antitoxin [Bacteriovorax sp.]|nr:type II toxin-antitoxin system MqsA family antitoxin [Bacteriovorax sp.]
MKCSMCDNDKILKKETIATHRYKECGLENVILHGITSYKCKKCGEHYLSFGDIEQLHNMIATALTRKASVLKGKEIRFLRKHLGYSAAVFAKLVGYENEHLSRIENDKNAVQEVFDRLVRMLVMEKLPDRKYDLQDLFLEGKFMSLDWLEFSLAKKGWKSQAAA